MKNQPKTNNEMEATINEEKSVFAVLNAINCNEHTEKKNGLTYLSWAWCWQMVKANFPESYYTIYENKDGLNYHTDGRTCWVKTGVTINGIEHIEYLPVMDFKNASIPVERVTSFDVNKAIQRSLTKACARHGLGLYIYAGEDLPDAGDEAKRGAADKVDENLELALQQVKEASSREELEDVYRSWSGYKNSRKFLDACSKRNQELIKSERR